MTLERQNVAVLRAYSSWPTVSDRKPVLEVESADASARADESRALARSATLQAPRTPGCHAS